MTDIRLLRVYEVIQEPDQNSFLIDRLWPRGISKAHLKDVVWLKEVAPSNELRKRFHADPSQWDAFCQDYIDELNNQQAWLPLLERLERGEVITLIYSSRDRERNQGVVLRDFLLKKLAA